MMRNPEIPQVINEQGQWLAHLDPALAAQNMSPDQGHDLAEGIEDLGALQMAARIREAARDAMRFRGHASTQQRPTRFAREIDPQKTNPTPDAAADEPA